MDTVLLLKALVLGIIEGLTEFLPISSTGHLIIAGQLLDFHDEKGKVFEIVIQAGAMLAVVWEYRLRFARAATGLRSDPVARRFVCNLAIAFVPAALLGLAFGSFIKAYLFHAVPVALAFVVGGFIILWVERRRGDSVVDSVDRITWKDALKVGIAQSFALIPGTSRSGATIIGGMLFGLSRRTATEFSFFLAVPTLAVAAAYDLYEHRSLFGAADVEVFGVGFVAAFISAFLCVRWLIRYVSSHDFTVFAWYRIAFGLVVLITAYMGAVVWSLYESSRQARPPAAIGSRVLEVLKVVGGRGPVRDGIELQRRQRDGVVPRGRDDVAGERIPEVTAGRRGACRRWIVGREGSPEAVGRLREIPLPLASSTAACGRTRPGATATRGVWSRT